MLQQTNPLAAAREQLDAAVASLLEAATAEVSGDALLRKSLAEGQHMERRRVMTLLMDCLDQHPRPSDPLRMLLLDLLEDVKGLALHCSMSPRVRHASRPSQLRSLASSWCLGPP
jgi:hypothetical protein